MTDQIFLVEVQNNSDDMKICLYTFRLPAALDSHNYAKFPLESDEESSSEYITESDTETTDGKSVSSSSSSGSSSSNSSSTETDSESSAEDKAEEGESDVVEGENGGPVSNQQQGIVAIIDLYFQTNCQMPVDIGHLPWLHALFVLLIHTTPKVEKLKSSDALQQCLSAP